MFLILITICLKLNRIFSKIEINNPCYVKDFDIICDNLNEFKNLNLFIMQHTYQINVYFTPRTNKILMPSSKLENIFYHDFHFYFINLKGIDIQTQNFQIDEKFTDCSISLIKSNFEFYFNEILLTDSDCESMIINGSFESIFPSLNSELILTDNKFKFKLCLFYFKNSYINIFTLTHMSNSFIKRNFIQFHKSNLYNSSKLNSTIIQLNFEYFYRIYLDLIMVNEIVFKSLNIIKIIGTLEDIQNDFFQNFRNILNIYIILNNLNEIVGKGFQWTKSIQKNRNNSKPGLIIGNRLDSIFNQYEFPEEDFCIFYEILLNENISLGIKKYYSNNDSCVLKLIYHTNKLIFSKIFIHYYHKNFTLYNQSIEYCKFDDMINNCVNFKNKTIIQRNQFDINDMEYITKIVQYLAQLVFQNLIIFIGFILNVITIFIFKKFKNDFMDIMYSYLNLNSAYNLVRLCIDILKIVNFCPDLNGLFCLTIYSTYFAQVIFIVISFMDGVLTFCSNISLILFSLRRLSLTNQNFHRKFDWIFKISIKKVVLFSLILGVLLNIIEIFLYKILSPINHSFGYEYPLKISASYITVYSQNTNKIIFIFAVLKYVINVLLFHVFYLFTDIKLLFEFKRFIFNKKKISSLSPEICSELDLHEKNLFKMVIFNNTLNFLVRLPEFIMSTLYNLTLYTTMSNFEEQDFLFKLFMYCNYELICRRLYESSKVFYHLLNFVNFFSLYFYNQIFLRNFNYFLKRKT